MAAALARRGCRVGLIAPKTTPPPSGARTIALWLGSIDILTDIFGNSDFLADGQPIRAMKIVDERGKETDYTPDDAEVSDQYPGYNLPLDKLESRVRALNAATTDIRRFDTFCQRLLEPGAVRCSDGTELDAKLLIVAEGARSTTARQAGIAPIVWNEGTCAVIGLVSHDTPHHQTAREYHRAPGPLAFVPLEERHSSIVWIKKRAEADALCADQDTALETLNRESFDIMQVTAFLEPLQAIPLHSLMATTLRASRLALIGETAHKMPPTGAQGLNLSLRDIALLAELVGDACQAGDDPGSDALLRHYSGQRLKDSVLTGAAVHLGNASIRQGGVFGTIRRGLQHRLMPALPRLQGRLMRRALYGF